MDLFVYVVGVVGIVLVVNALRRPASPRSPLPPAWLPAMLVSELAPLFMLGTALLAAVGITFARDSQAGRLGTGLLVVVLAGLTALMIRSRSAVRTLAPHHEVPRPRSIVGRQRPPAAVTITTHHYAPDLTLDLLQPSESAGATPCFVWVHGGGWTGGNPYSAARTLNYTLVERGWSVAAIRYPLSPDATHPEHAEAVIGAIRWLQVQGSDLGLDPGRLAIGGASAGAHLASLAALTLGNGDADSASAVRGCVTLYGIYDFLNRNATRKNWPVIPRAVMKAPVADTDAYRSASPLDLVHADAPPFLVVHGTHDSLVPPAEGRIFAETLEAVSRAPVEFVEVGGAQHAFDAIASARTRAATARIVTFLEGTVA